ncbi:hypothetical protein CBER1_04068 [Cercospora berteroae]|uniref:cAMP-dependent protein kinase regulatory subunit n=1 Tax=Cercospora berteroae TaxID=357750 RepID=A0A2S6C502_9PEZI|nr:hypothetical protein CBER1_04068 [Cercospora berteroae]
MSLPSDYTNEIGALNREVLKHQPKDILQFCANFFQRRLESQRAEFLLSHRHSSQPGMAESTFPGSNPFTSTAPNQLAGTGGGMHSLAEEEEHDDFASPTASSFPPHVREVSPTDPSTAPNSAAGGTFGNFGGFGAPRSSNQAPPAPSDNMSQSAFPNNYNMNRRTSVSAESLAPGTADDSNWKAPSYPKTAEQLARLREAVSHNFLFKNLDEDQASQVLNALQEKRVPAKDVRVITQGESGDYFYVVESGRFDIYISHSGKAEQGQAGLGDKVASNGPGTSFGELALMYNAPRAATVVSTEPSVLWQLDRLTFRKILMDSAFQRRRMYESFLEGVPLLSSLTPYERSKIADALDTVKHPAGSTIIQEGDAGDKFYILEAGEAVAVKRGREQQPLKRYKPGDYFGELALLEDKPRAASVVSTSEVKVAALDKDGFQRLLGPVEAIMRRDDPRNQEGVDPLR